MITSEQIKEHRFLQDENGGYDKSSVDEYIQIVAGEYDRLFSENREIIKRLSVFAKKIEEYKNNEGVVADTLLTAQKTAAQTIAGAESVVKRMLESAKVEGRNIINKAKADADDIKLDRDTILNEAQNTAKEMYNNASDAVEKMFAEARKKSDGIVEDAVAQAEKTANSANEKSIRILEQAENKANDIVSKAEASADSIKEKASEDARNVIDESKRQVSEIKFKSDAEISVIRAEVNAKKDELEKEYRQKLSVLDDEQKRNLEKSYDIIDEAKAQADAIIDEAKVHAEKLLADAKTLSLQLAKEIRDNAFADVDKVNKSEKAETEDDNFNQSPFVIITEKGLNSVNGDMSEDNNTEETETVGEKTAETVIEEFLAENEKTVDEPTEESVGEYEEPIEEGVGTVDEFSVDFSVFGLEENSEEKPEDAIEKVAPEELQDEKAGVGESEEISEESVDGAVIEENIVDEINEEIITPARELIEENEKEKADTDLFNAMFDDIPEAEIDEVASFDSLLYNENETDEENEENTEIADNDEGEQVHDVIEDVKYDMFAGSVFDDSADDSRFDDAGESEITETGTEKKEESVENIDDIIDKFEIDFSSFEDKGTEKKSVDDGKKKKFGKKNKQ